MAATSSISPNLAPGMLSIYGVPSIYGFGHNDGVAFGVIHQMSIANSGAYSVGQNVLVPFRGANYITYANVNYWLIEESKIILVEVPDDISS